MSGCDPNHVFLLPINFIKKPKSKTLKRHFKPTSASTTFNNFICGIKEFVKSPPKGNKYYTHENAESDTASLPRPRQDKRSLTPDLAESSNDGKMNSGSKLPSSLSSPNLAKQDSGSSTTSSNRYSDLISFSEDYAKSVEEREKRIEERGKMSQSRSSLSNGGERTPKSKKKTIQFPVAPNRDIKPAVILSLADRDLVVIDKHDIKEAVSNESQVIIVDPPKIATSPSAAEEHADLADILGSNWPEHAGHAGALLNNEKKSSSTSTSGSSNNNNGWRTIERNKSANIASHLSNSKPRYESSNGYDNNRTLPKKSE